MARQHLSTDPVGTASRAELEGAREWARPTSLAGQHLLPVLPALAELLPDGGLRRGTTVTVDGSTALALALAAGPSGAGSWVAVVGMASLGLAAVVEAGLDLSRLALVAPPPPREWATVTATLLDAFDVVLADPPARVRPTDARRLAARGRERGAALVLVSGQAGGQAWPVPVEVRLRAVASSWQGLGEGHGRLAARRVEVVAGGRGAAARERRAALWLPDPAGGVTRAEPAPAVRARPALQRVG